MFRVLDIINLVLFMVQIPLHMCIFFLVENSGLDKPSPGYQELSGIFYLVTIELQLNSTMANISLMYLKVFKYTRRIHMVKKAGEDLYVFNMMLLVVLLGFAQAGRAALWLLGPTCIRPTSALTSPRLGPCSRASRESLTTVR